MSFVDTTPASLLARPPKTDEEPHRYAPPPVEQHDLPWRDFQHVTRLAVFLGIASGFLYLSFLYDREHENVPILWIFTVIAESLVVLHTLGIWYTMLGYRHDIPETADLGVVRRELLTGAHPTPTIDVFITHATESLDLLLPTMVAARDMLLPHRTWVLDDGRNPNVREACLRLGIGYMRRSDNRHAKAGNVNAAIERTDGEYIVLIDADHVPRPDFLVHTLPNMLVNPAVAMVQSPQTYRTEKRGLIAEGAAVSQRLFYEAIMPAKNLSNAIICVGTNVIFRRAALESLRTRDETPREKRKARRRKLPADRPLPTTPLGREYPRGGLWIGSNSEDIWTSLELQRRGWRSVFVPKVLSEGLTPDTIASFMKQQFRWAVGGWEMMFRAKVFRDHRLTVSQKLQYLLISTHYLQSFSVMVFAVLSPLYLLTDRSPISSPAWWWALHYVPFMFFTLTVTFVQVGQFRPAAVGVSLAAVPVHIRAFFFALFRIKSPWVITNTRQGGGVLRYFIPHLFLGVLDVAAITFGLSVQGQETSSIAIAVFWSILHIVIVAYQISGSYRARRLAERAGRHEPNDVEALALLDEYLLTAQPTELNAVSERVLEGASR